MLASKNVYCDHSSMICFNARNKKNIHTPNILHQNREDGKKIKRTFAILTPQKKKWGTVCWSPSGIISSKDDSQVFHVLVQCFNCKTSVLLLLDGDI